jgi:hypothetical protein
MSGALGSCLCLIRITPRPDHVESLLDAKSFHLDSGSRRGTHSTLEMRSMTRAAWAFLLGLTILFVGASDASAGQFNHAAYYRAGQQPRHLVATRLSSRS